LSQLGRVIEPLEEDRSAEPVSGWLGRHDEFKVCLETICPFLLEDRKLGGDFDKLPRSKGRKQRRKRYGANDSRGRCDFLCGSSSKPQRPLDIAQATGHGETLPVVQHNHMLALEHRLQFLHAVQIHNRAAADAEELLRIKL